jgi:ribosome-associated protein
MDALRPARGVTIPLDAVQIRTSRSSGPGGQHANVTASRVEALLVVADCEQLSPAQQARVTAKCGAVVRAIAQDNRSQTRNRELALQRLEERLSRALHVARPRRATKPTKGSQRRRVDAKKQRGEKKAQRRRPSADD